MCTRVLLVCLSLAFAISFHLPALALDPSGTALAVIQSVSASGPGGSRELQSERPVYSGDVIKTGPVGQAQIRFRDDTRLVVAANSSLVIDRYVFNPSRSGATLTVNAVKGAFRFISGTSGSQAYSIRTRTATIGVRGTRFDVAVSRHGTGVVVFEGAVRLCGRSGSCITVSDNCGAAVALPDGRVGPITSSADKAAQLRARFPLILNQSSLLSDFRVNTSGCGDTGGSFSPDSFGTREARAASTSSLSPEPEPEPEPEPGKDHHGKHDHHGKDGHHDGKDGHEGKGSHMGRGDHEGRGGHEGKDGHEAKGGYEGKGGYESKGSHASRDGQEGPGGPESRGGGHESHGGGHESLSGGESHGDSNSGDSDGGESIGG